MKKILILQMRPEDEATDSEFEAILRIGEIARDQAEQIRVEQGEIVDVDLDRYCAIIAGGSPFDISYPTDKKSEAQQHVESFFTRLFDQVVPNDFPFLGACSGNGLLGKYCGTSISSKYSEPIGSVMVQVTEEGAKDPLLVDLPKQFLALAGHKEACDTVPQDAVLLATSEACPVQMFRLKNNIYATQFHPEADVGEYIIRIHTYKYHGYFPPEEAEELIAAIQGTETPHAHEILRRFVSKYKTETRS
ncbi:MAG: glutamine amidotransferase [Eudoraea sp.]|nr:glutamine amidotransferase [Eudoraea sp.]